MTDPISDRLTGEVAVITEVRRPLAERRSTRSPPRPNPGGRQRGGRTGITGNGVCPGTPDNLFNDLSRWPDSHRKGVSKDEGREATLGASPIGAFPDPAGRGSDLVVVLASAQDGYVISHAINTTGGQDMH